MALRGVKPTEIKKRLKAFFYGQAGVGKTTAAIQFPAPYLIDTERGAENNQYIKLLEKSGGVVFQSSDYDEIILEIKSLMTEKHEFKTIIIDPLTTVYNELVEKCSIKYGEEYGKHLAAAEKKMKSLFNLLTRLDMNVVITSHSKVQYGSGMTVLGNTFDCYKKMDFLFDLVLEIQKRGNERFGLIKKSRIESFIDGDSFKFSYQEISNRYGNEMLEKDSQNEELATIEQIKSINHLVSLLKVSDETIQKWFKKCKSDSFEDMPSSCIQKCIDMLETKIKGE